MRRHVVFFVALCGLVTSQGFAQEFPPRFEPLAKNDRFRLMRVLGSPEIPATFNPTTTFSADGKFAIYAEDLSGGADDMPRLRARGCSCGT